MWPYVQINNLNQMQGPVTEVERHLLHAAFAVEGFDGRQVAQTLAPFTEAHAQLAHKLARQGAFGTTFGHG